MSDSSSSQHADDPIFDHAEEWAGKRKPHQLICELFVRLAQLAAVTMNVLKALGLSDDGTLPTVPTPSPDTTQSPPQTAPTTHTASVPGE